MRFETGTGTNPDSVNTMGNEVMIPVENVENEVQERVSEIETALMNSPEVREISKQVDVANANSILEFGNAPAVEISKFADKILHSIKSSSVENSSVMIQELTKIMKKFDRKDFEEADQGFFKKLFATPQKLIEQLMSKYQTIGGEIDKIYTEIARYKEDINKTNVMLEDMYKQNFQYYQQLEKYVIAGKMVVKEMEAEDLPYFEDKARGGEQMDIVNLENVKNAIEMFKQRIYDLEMAKMVSLQTAPQIKMIQKGNYKLVGKIHSAFVVTIPTFKNGLIQAVALKRQKLVAQSMDALDQATNELLVKNAQNIKDQSVEIARLTGGPSVKTETLEKTWSIIMQGIEETQSIEEENKRLREEGVQKINSIQADMMKKFRGAV